MIRSRLPIFRVGFLALTATAAVWMATVVSGSAASTGNVGVQSGARVPTGVAQAQVAADIPDNQVFLKFRNTAGGYLISYPEGWLQQGAGPKVTFHDKDNRLQVVISKGAPFSPASVKADVASLQSATPSLKAAPAAQLALPSGTAFKVSYSTVSAPDSVTGKRVSLVADRYYLSKTGKRATVDLASAKGADNVDAYRLIITSFRWL